MSDIPERECSATVTTIEWPGRFAEAYHWKCNRIDDHNSDQHGWVLDRDAMAADRERKRILRYGS